MGPETQLTVTLELLKTPCLLIHIPRPRISEFSHHVTKQLIETHRRSFLSITTNAIEMTIIADEDSMQELAQAAQYDLARWRRSKHKDDPFTEPLDVSDEPWSVFIVETHEEQAQEQPAAASNRVRELSEPLAKAGISILYQSSYMNDYILVQTRRVEETIIILCNSGYSLVYDEDTFTSRITPPPVSDPYGRSPPSSPTHGLHSPYFSGLGDDISPSMARNIGPAGGVPGYRSTTMLTRSSPNTSRIKKPELSISIEGLGLSPHGDATSAEDSETTQSPPVSSSRQSLCISPLSATLAMVGLPEETAESWILKVIRLFVYPRLLHPTFWTRLDLARQSLRSTSSASGLPYNSISILDFPPAGTAPDDARDGDTVDTSPLSSDREWLSGKATSSQPRPRGGSSALPSQQKLSMSDVGGPNRRRQTTTSAPMPLPEVRSSRSSSSSSVSSSTSQLSSDPPLYPPPTLQMRLASIAASIAALPFVSFTHTAQGTSLITDIYSLHTVFPTAEERQQMLRCADELDDLPPIPTESLSRHPSYQHMPHGTGFSGSGTTWSQIEQLRDAAMRKAARRPTTFNCLQVDLREFQLDKHGVVYRLSEALHSSDIHHLFSSTFKTANVLVACADASNALAVLTDVA